MINEGRGISEINKVESESIFNLFKKVGYSINNDYKFNNLDIKINFKKGYNSNLFNIKDIYIFNFEFSEKSTDNEIKEVISHEINHLIELISITTKKYRFPIYDSIKKSLLKFNPKTEEMQFFKHTIYKILDNEINANVAQTYTYLKQFNNDDKKFLIKKLEEYQKRRDYIILKNFNIKKLISYIKNNVDASNELIALNNLFITNNVDRYLNFLYKINNVDFYINNWFKLVKINVNKLLKKQDNVIKEVIEDINEGYSTEYPISESTLLNYNEYLKKSK